MNYFVMLLVLSFSLHAAPVKAMPTCHGRLINPLTDICWECLFPFTIGGVTGAKSRVPDTQNPTNPACLCYDGILPRLGVTTGYWEPRRIVEVTPTPFCLVSLGGIKLNVKWLHGQGGIRETPDRFPMGHYEAHFLAYPLLSWIGVVDSALCHDKGDWDLLYMSEFDPLWHNETLAALFDPESLRVTSKAASLACGMDCVQSSMGLTNDKLFWCAGCLGHLYPLTSTVAVHRGGIASSSLITARVLALLHRRGLIKSLATHHTDQTLCTGKRALQLSKSEYRLQLLYPKAETTLKKGCQPLGHSVLSWSAGDEFPGAGEHFAYLLFQKHNCCAF
jgi:conjugal transfer pilus assembly protein TraU